MPAKKRSSTPRKAKKKRRPDSIVLRDENGEARIILEASSEFPYLLFLHDDRQLEIALDGGRARIATRTKDRFPETVVVLNEHGLHAVYTDQNHLTYKVGIGQTGKGPEFTIRQYPKPDSRQASSGTPKSKAKKSDSKGPKRGKPKSRSAQSKR